MRALRIILIITVVLAGIFVAADRLLVGFAEDKAADRLRTSEGLDRTPDVSIEGFPFLTQVVGGEFDEVRVRIDGLDASAEGEKVRIEELDATMRGVRFSGDYGSATANRASGTALIAYRELLKAAQVEPVELVPGVNAKVVGLADGGDGKIEVTVDIQGSVLGVPVDRKATVLSRVAVEGGVVKVNADKSGLDGELGQLKALGAGVGESRIRAVTDFQQQVDRLPSGIEIDKVEATPEGVAISVTGTQVRLAG
ncbi:LmeA family phospholipid-binding protein [Streptomyces sp. O3]